MTPPWADAFTFMLLAALVLGGALVLFAKIAKAIVRIVLAIALLVAAALLAISTSDDDKQNGHASSPQGQHLS